MRRFSAAFSVLFCLTFLFGTAVSAQNLKTLAWQTELCEFQGAYDPAKYTEKELLNTIELINSVGSIPLFTRSTVIQHEDIEKLSVAELDNEYEKTIKRLINMEIVKDDYWEKLRRAKIRETEQSYHLQRLTIRGYTNPKILLEAENVGECLANYAEPLATGGESLLETWRTVNKKSQAKNASPERMQKRFELEFASPDRFKYALVEVTTYGWWNCVNDTIEYVDYNEDHRGNFKKLFVKVEENCNEP